MNYIEHLDRIMEALQLDRATNAMPAIEEPANDFEKSINDWEELQRLLANLKKLLEPLELDERKTRDGIAESLRTFYGDELKEGVNNYELSNYRKLRFTHKVERKIEPSMVPVAREAYENADDKPAVVFDDLLRVKYELAATPFKKLAAAPQASTAVSRMIVSKFAAPTLVVD